MTQRKTAKEKERADELSPHLKRLSDWLDKTDAANKNGGMLGYNIKAPYSDARQPTPTRWQTD